MEGASVDHHYPLPSPPLLTSLVPPLTRHPAFVPLPVPLSPSPHPPADPSNPARSPSQPPHRPCPVLPCPFHTALIEPVLQPPPYPRPSRKSFLCYRHESKDTGDRPLSRCLPSASSALGRLQRQGVEGTVTARPFSSSHYPLQDEVTLSPSNPDPRLKPSSWPPETALSRSTALSRTACLQKRPFPLTCSLEVSYAPAHWPSPLLWAPSCPTCQGAQSDVESPICQGPGIRRTVAK